MLLSSEATRAERHSGGLRLTVRTPDGDQTIDGSHLLAAAGRTPNTDSLNLSAAGIETDKHGSVKVNDRLETNVPGVYAIGDVKGGPQFTHISYDDFRIIRTNLIQGGDATIERSPCALHGFHGPAARPSWVDRNGGSLAWLEHSSGETTDD